MSAISTIMIAKHSIGRSIVLSVLMILAGILAIVIPLAAGIAATILIGWLLIFAGWTHLLLGWHVRAAGGLVWQLLLGLLYILGGSYLLLNASAGLASLMIALATYLFAAGNIEFMLFFRMRQTPGSSWLLVDGAITLILAILILGTLPWSASWGIGTVVGISILFSGISRLGLSLGARPVSAGLHPQSKNML